MSHLAGSEFISCAIQSVLKEKNIADAIDLSGENS